MCRTQVFFMPFESAAAAERSIIKKYRKTIWHRFITAVKEYELIQDGDRIAVCISGGKDSMLLAKCMQELQRHSYQTFELAFLVMDPGYAPENRARIIENARRLQIPIRIFDAPIFEAVTATDDSPCYLCARMRRGYLYKFAQTMGCNKIALGHHFDDMIETGLMSMFYGAEIKTMMPKLHSTNFDGMELIRPLYLVRERDILAWKRYNGLEFLQCACTRTEKLDEATGTDGGKRSATKALIRALKAEDDQIDVNIFRSLHNANLGALPGTVKNGVHHSFLEEYDNFDRRMEFAVFDVDGTLLDSMHIWREMGSRYLISQGITPPEDLYEQMEGMGLAAAVRWCIEKFDLPVTEAEGCRQVIDLVYDFYANEVTAKPFAREFLEKLEKDGVRICAASNSEADYLRPALERLGMLQRMECVLTPGILGVSKETPEYWHRVAERLGTTTDKLTVFEDALYSMKIAKQAGCRVVAVYDPAEKEHNDEIRTVCDYYAGGFSPFVK